MNTGDKIQVLDKNTSEIKNGYFVYVAYSKAKIKNVRWIMTFQDSLAKIATDEDMTGENLKVLLLIMSELEFENYIHIKQVDIAKTLKMQRSNVSRSVKLLVDKGIILKVKDGRTTGYKLNLEYGWKGKVSKMNKEKQRLANGKIVNFEEYAQAKKATNGKLDQKSH